MSRSSVGVLLALIGVLGCVVVVLAPAEWRVGTLSTADLAANGGGTCWQCSKSDICWVGTKKSNYECRQNQGIWEKRWGSLKLRAWCATGATKCTCDQVKNPSVDCMYRAECNENCVTCYPPQVTDKVKEDCTMGGATCTKDADCE